MSSGLVATLGLPAQAVASGDKANPSTQTLPAIDAVPVSATIDSSSLALPSSAAAAVPVTASATAKVTFEAPSFRAKPASRKAAAPHKAAPAPVVGAARGSSVLALAARYVGVPYVYGGSTPRGFDCSGFVRYVFNLLGVHLPRTAEEQMLATRRVPRSQARPGDLVFFLSGGRAYHVGIYAGGSMMYDSPRPGKRLAKRAIWSSNIVFGRVV